MPHPVSHLVSFAIPVLFPWLLVRRGRRDLAMVTALADLISISALTLFDPERRTITVALLTALLFAFNLAAWIGPESLERAVIARMRRSSFKIALTLLGVTLVPLGSLELACRALTGLGILKYHRAIQTVWRSGHDDWRLATITGDENREPDPELLWRPVAHKPFNSDRFKGPELLDPKPPDGFRVMCYGDSLTDGPPKGGWPRWLELLFRKDPDHKGRPIEVVNAGVAGYSSHQGLLRFLREVDQYHPDLLLVSFGWNDAAEAIGQPDKTFQVPPWPIVAFQRAVVRYRAYLVLMYYTRQWRPQPPSAVAGIVHPRVCLDDYLANMDRFRAEAQARGIPIAFLTRPHKVPATELQNDPTWRGSVPRYNAALRAWAQSQAVPLIDVEREFESLPSSLFSDECHFLPRGYEKMAEIVHARLLHQFADLAPSSKPREAATALGSAQDHSTPQATATGLSTLLR